jgi:hypothetical protein
MRESREVKEQEVGVRWLPVCEKMSPEAEERSLLEDVTQQCSKDHHWKH